jgi:hypothetical protein
LRWAARDSHLRATIAHVERVDGELVGIHRTYLRSDGTGKADVAPQKKAMAGRAAGGAVRLVGVGGLLMIGEGVRSTIAVLPRGVATPRFVRRQIDKPCDWTTAPPQRPEGSKFITAIGGEMIEIEL